MAKMVTTHMATNALLAKIWLSIFSGLLAKHPQLILEGSNEWLFILSTYFLPGSLLPYSPITLLPAPVYMCTFWSSFGRSQFTIVKCGEILRGWTGNWKEATSKQKWLF